MNPVEWLLRLFFPPRCIFCSDLLEQEEADRGICGKCAGQIGLARKNSRPIPLVDRVVWALNYEGVVRDALHAYKFKGQQDKAAPFGNIMAGVVLNWED